MNVFAPRMIRSRVAVPIEPPVLKPSLIPFDVMQDVEREAKLQALDEVHSERDSQTSPVPVPDDALLGEGVLDESLLEDAPSEEASVDELAMLAESPADPAVAHSTFASVPLFKKLASSTLDALAAGATQLEVPAGELLFAEGEEASSFSIVIDGTIEVVKEKDGRPIALRHMSRGDVLGLFGLFSGQQRAASARAVGKATVLVVSGAQLQAVVDRDETLHGRLLDFYQERLLEGFLASKVFADLDSGARTRVRGRFKHRDVAAGEALLNPGEVSNLIAVVTHGTLVLEERSNMGGQPRHFEIGAGQFLFVTCALSGLPSKLRLFANGFATVSMLSQRDLNELSRDYPALKALPSRLPTMARQLERDVFSGAAGVAGV